MFWAQDATTHLPWAREVPFRTVHSVSRFLSLSNNLGNLLFARRTTPTVVSDRIFIQRKSRWTSPRSAPAANSRWTHRNTEEGDLSEDCYIFRTCGSVWKAPTAKSQWNRSVASSDLGEHPKTGNMEIERCEAQYQLRLKSACPLNWPPRSCHSNPCDDVVPRRYACSWKCPSPSNRKPHRPSRMCSRVVSGSGNGTTSSTEDRTE